METIKFYLESTMYWLELAYAFVCMVLFYGGVFASILGVLSFINKPNFTAVWVFLIATVCIQIARLMGKKEIKYI